MSQRVSFGLFHKLSSSVYYLPEHKERQNRRIVSDDWLEGSVSCMSRWVVDETAIDVNVNISVKKLRIPTG